MYGLSIFFIYLLFYPGRGFKHQGPNKSLKFGNMTLEVRKIPHEMNNIAKLNEHFGKFGTLTNIQVSFGALKIFCFLFLT